MLGFKEFIAEDGNVAANCVGGGQVAGLGGPNGEPGVNKKKKNNPVLATMRRIRTGIVNVKKE